MDAVFDLRAHEVSEIWASLLHTFTKEGLLQLPGSGVCVALASYPGHTPPKEYFSGGVAWG